MGKLGSGRERPWRARRRRETMGAGLVWTGGGLRVAKVDTEEGQRTDGASLAHKVPLLGRVGGERRAENKPQGLFGLIVIGLCIGKGLFVGRAEAHLGEPCWIRSWLGCPVFWWIGA